MLAALPDTIIIFHSWNIPDRKRNVKPPLEEKEERRMYGIQEEKLGSLIDEI